ncbi:MAG: hypothetical protein IKC59_02395 [Clostridia bacterium]|nr:hypothetical protein [Clostridia bacterium]
MKVCVIQPHYSFDAQNVGACCDALIELLEQCDNSLDLIVLPEYSDALADVQGKDGYYGAVSQFSVRLLQKATETAKRCGASVFVNAGFFTPHGIRNTTHVIDRNGNTVGRYFKAHPAPSEVKTDTEGGHELDVTYSYETDVPYVIELDGIRFGFLTCYDFYFYENFAQIARQNVDVIIGCALQRTDTHEALSIINRFLCYNTNAYLIRASVSLDEASSVCGCSMVVSPKGEILLNLENRVGLGICEIDPTEKYYKPAGHGGAPKAHYEYIEEGRRPWLYRNGGASVVPFDCVMSYPRLCAVGGLCTVAPKNSLPALGSAVALGVEELSLELCRNENGILSVCEHPDGGTFKKLKAPVFEEILRKFAGRVIINVQIDQCVSDKTVREIVSLITRYDCALHIYLTSASIETIGCVRKYAPSLPICLDWDGSATAATVLERAIAIGAKKMQLPAFCWNKETIERAHANGIRCILCHADDLMQAKAYLDMGIDTLLTDDCLSFSHLTAHS